MLNDMVINLRANEQLWRQLVPGAGTGGTVSGGAEVGPTLAVVSEERTIRVLLAVTHVAQWEGIGAPPGSPHRPYHVCARGSGGPRAGAGVERPSL